MLTNTRVPEYVNVHNASAQHVPVNIPLDVFYTFLFLFFFFSVFVLSTVGNDICIFIDTALHVKKHYSLEKSVCRHAKASLFPSHCGSEAPVC